eukprot:6133816-Amphidinium_carterae.1
MDYVKVHDPKMRRPSARREHVFVEQPTFVVLLEVILKARPRCSLLLAGGVQALRSMFSTLLKFFGFPEGD